MRAAWGIQMRSGESDIEDWFERHRKKEYEATSKVWVYMFGGSGQGMPMQHQSEIENFKK
jgi:hypothetical protein